MPEAISGSFKRPRRMLTNIRWRETSGVDEPANEEEGWMLMKMKELGDELDKVLKSEAEIVEKQERLHSILGGINWDEAPYKGAPQKIKEAVQVIADWLETEGVGKPEYGYTEPGKKSTPKKNIYDTLRESIRAFFSRKGVYKMADEEVMKAISQHWGEFCKSISSVIKSVDKDKKVLEVIDVLESNIINTLSEEES